MLRLRCFSHQLSMTKKARNSVSKQSEKNISNNLSIQQEQCKICSSDRIAGFWRFELRLLVCLAFQR
jgi:hypothetical protein